MTFAMRELYNVTILTYLTFTNYILRYNQKILRCVALLSHVTFTWLVNIDGLPILMTSPSIFIIVRKIHHSRSKTFHPWNKKIYTITLFQTALIIKKFDVSAIFFQFSFVQFIGLDSVYFTFYQGRLESSWKVKFIVFNKSSNMTMLCNKIIKWCSTDIIEVEVFRMAMAITRGILFVGLLLLNRNTLGYPSFIPDNIGYEGFRPKYAMGLHEKVENKYFQCI